MLSPHYYHQDGTRDGSRGNRLRCLSDHRTRRRKRRRRLHPSLQRKRGTSGREPGSHSTHRRPDSLRNRDTGSRAGSDRREASRAAHHHRGRHRCSTRGGGVMQTLLDILKRAGGWNPGLYLKIENAPYMALVIEATDESGPSGLPAISVAHYGEQNGDLMRDPEMCFELGFAEGPHLEPFYFRNDYLGIEQWTFTARYQGSRDNESPLKVAEPALDVQGGSCGKWPKAVVFRVNCRRVSELFVVGK